VRLRGVRAREEESGGEEGMFALVIPSDIGNGAHLAGLADPNAVADGGHGVPPLNCCRVSLLVGCKHVIARLVVLSMIRIPQESGHSIGA